MSNALKKLIEQNACQHPPVKIFSDFVEMAALAVRNSVDMAQFDEREKRYLHLIGQYEKDEQHRFGKMFAELVNEMEREPRDVLGDLFMGMGFGNDRSGQFFTPMSVCNLMSKICIDQQEIEEIIRTRGFIRCCDPACGAGALPISFALKLHAAGIDYQKHLHVTACDIDMRVVHMCYLQLSLMGVPAIVVHGNTLSLQTYDHWFTPMHILNGWTWRLRKGEEKPCESHETDVFPPVPPGSGSVQGLKPGQLSLF